MKKTLSILLLSLFIAANSGVAMTIHFCCGKFSTVEFDSSLDQCGCKKHSHCCTSKTVVVKLKHSFQKNIIQTKISPSNTALYIVCRDNITSTYGNDLKGTWLRTGDSPPLARSCIILNKVFRI